MFWAIGVFLLLLIALLIPILAIVLDSPIARNFFRGSDAADINELVRRIQALENDVENLGRALEAHREETQFVQRLLEGPDRDESSAKQSRASES